MDRGLILRKYRDTVLQVTSHWVHMFPTPVEERAKSETGLSQVTMSFLK
jgi:hypothetical protein